MTGIKQYEPLWGAWRVESPIGEGSFGKVYKIKKEEFGKTYWSAVKVLSIPQSKEDLSRARSEGLDEASARSYFHAFVTDIIQEVDLMYAFRGNSNIVSFEEHKVIEHEDEIGWDILIRMELLRSLSEHVTEKPLTPGDVVKLGIHICRALELCALKKTIHRDIKPDNIFVSQYGDYKLGDFGIARQIERTSSGLSKKGTDTYMAPEVYRGEEYGASVDTYSLGVVMYRYLNQNRPPFLSEFPNPITPRGREDALMRRMRGEPLPPIPGADPSLMAIVMKACAFERGKRFLDAEAMRNALEDLTGVRDYAPSLPQTPNQPQTLPPLQDFFPPQSSPQPSAYPSFPAASPESPRTYSPPPSYFEPTYSPTSATSATEGIFRARVNPHIEEEKPAERQAGQWLSREALKVLSLWGGALFAVLALLCLPGGTDETRFVFLPLYCFCAAQCFLGFGSPRLSAVFLLALVAYLAYSFLFAFAIFDYHAFIFGWSFLALYAVSAPKKNLSLAFCLALTACSAGAGFLVIRALNGIPEGVYHDYVAGGTAAPFLMLFIAAAALCMRTERPGLVFYALAGVLAVQCFPLVMFVWRALAGSQSYVAEAGFTRMALAGFGLWSGWRFGIALLQCCAFAVLSALAFMNPTGLRKPD